MANAIPESDFRIAGECREANPWLLPVTMSIARAARSDPRLHRSVATTRSGFIQADCPFPNTAHLWIITILCISIVIPAFNEARLIERFCNPSLCRLPRTGHPGAFEVIGR